MNGYVVDVFEEMEIMAHSVAQTLVSILKDKLPRVPLPSSVSNFVALLENVIGTRSQQNFNVWMIPNYGFLCNVPYQFVISCEEQSITIPAYAEEDIRDVAQCSKNAKDQHVTGARYFFLCWHAFLDILRDCTAKDATSVMLKQALCLCNAIESSAALDQRPEKVPLH